MLDRGAQLGQPVLRGYDLLAGHVAAALRPHLVLEEEARRAGLLPELDGAGDVERVAVAGVGIDDHRRLGAGGAHPRRGRGHLGLREVPDVRQAEQRPRHAVARQEHGLEAGLGGQPRAQGVPDARHEDALPRGELPSQVIACHRCGTVVEVRCSPVGGRSRTGRIRGPCATPASTPSHRHRPLSPLGSSSAVVPSSAAPGSAGRLRPPRPSCCPMASPARSVRRSSRSSSARTISPPSSRLCPPRSRPPPPAPSGGSPRGGCRRRPSSAAPSGAPTSRSAPPSAASRPSASSSSTTPPAPTSRAEPAQVVRDMYHYHVKGRGFSDVGYNFAIDHRGTIYEGRWSRRYGSGETPDGEDGSGYGVVGAHSLGVNAGSCGVVLIGDFTKAQPTTAAIGSAHPPALVEGVDAPDRRAGRGGVHLDLRRAPPVPEHRRPPPDR